ncbi:MAG: flippase-like domain-containing protein [Rhodospirillales bacterium]|nr:flippase-like domain-containing protein [Rhodospirillales bacterium]
MSKTAGAKYRPLVSLSRFLGRYIINNIEIPPWSVVGHINNTTAIFILAVGLNLNVTFFDCLALFPPVMLATAIPISIGGWGVREGAMVATFGLVGVPTEGGLVLSVLAGLIGIMVSLPGGVLWSISGYSRKEALN